MDGLVGRLHSTPGNRDALARELVDGVGEMPGCLYYVVSLDPDDADALWITEAWETEEQHADWLALPSTRALVERIGPLWRGYESRVAATPVGGHLGAGRPLGS